MLDTLYYLHEYGIRCYTKAHVRGVTVFTRLYKDEKILYYCERLFEAIALGLVAHGNPAIGLRE